MKTTITLTEKQKAEIEKADYDALVVKGQISNLTLEILVAEQKRLELYKTLEQKQAQYHARLLKIGGLHGIDFDEKPEETGFHWTFDYAKKQFARTDNPKTETPPGIDGNVPPAAETPPPPTKPSKKKLRSV